MTALDDTRHPSRAEERLRRVPWGALRRVAPALDRPIAEITAGASAERVVDRTLRALAPLERGERATVAEALFGIAVWRLRLDHHLAGTAPTPRLRLAALLRDVAAHPGAEELLGLAPGSLPPPLPAPLDLATRYSFPRWLADTLLREAGPDAELLADALDCPGPVCLRPNALRVSADELARRLHHAGVETRRGRLVPDALVVTSPHPNLHGLDAWRDALFEVQDEASQLVARIVAATPGESVLDLCAGAGGKTLALACAVGAGGAVHAADPDGERLQRLRERARRAGADGIVLVHGDRPPDDLQVDRVLVDAPCSELGALRRGPDLRYRVDPRSFPAVERLQRQLLHRGAANVRPGGLLVYATCTLRSEENESVAAAFEEGRPEFQRTTWVRTWPHRDGCDGFFIAAWQRRP